MKKAVIFFICVCLPLFLVSSASALIILPTVDGEIEDSGPSGGDGTPDNIIDTIDILVNNSNDPSFPRRHGIFEFDISSALSPVSSAVFQLNFLGLANDQGDFPLDVYTYEGDGTIQLSDYSAGSLFSTVMYNANIPTLNLDVTNYINGLLANNINFAGFNLRTESANAAIFLNSLEQQSSFNPLPTRLLIDEPSNAVPEPATIILLGGGIATALLKRRKYS